MCFTDVAVREAATSSLKIRLLRKPTDCFVSTNSSLQKVSNTLLFIKYIKTLCICVPDSCSTFKICQLFIVYTSCVKSIHEFLNKLKKAVIELESVDTNLKLLDL